MIIPELAYTYAKEIIENSQHCYVGTAYDCQQMSIASGSPITSMRRVVFDTGFSPKHTIGVHRVGYPDGSFEYIIMYDTDMVCKILVEDNGDYEIPYIDDDDKNWWVDLTILHHLAQSGR